MECSDSSFCGWSVRKDVTFQTHSDFPRQTYVYKQGYCEISLLNTFTAIVNLSRFNNSCLKSSASTLVDLTFQSRALRSFSLNQLPNLSL